MWRLECVDEYERRRKRYQKDRPNELLAVLDNLDTYHKSLDMGAEPLRRVHGFMHIEPSGVIAIDQKGGGRYLAQTRLYVYPDTETETLYVITLGDKQSQRQDIQTCREFVKQIRQELQTRKEGQEKDGKQGQEKDGEADPAQ